MGPDTGASKAEGPSEPDERGKGEGTDRSDNKQPVDEGSCNPWTNNEDRKHDQPSYHKEGEIDAGAGHTAQQLQKKRVPQNTHHQEQPRGHGNQQRKRWPYQPNDRDQTPGREE